MNNVYTGHRLTCFPTLDMSLMIRIFPFTMYFVVPLGVSAGLESCLAVLAPAVRRQVLIRPGSRLLRLRDGVVGIAALLRGLALRLPRQHQDSPQGPILSICEYSQDRICYMVTSHCMVNLSVGPSMYTYSLQ